MLSVSGDVAQTKQEVPRQKCMLEFFFFNQSKMAHSSRVDCNGAVLVHNVFFSSVRSQAAISSKKNYNNVIRLIT